MTDNGNIPDCKNKIPNLKEFVKYLNKTIDMFDHLSEEDFEKKDSDVGKLFHMLFNMYTDPETSKIKYTPDRFNDNNSKIKIKRPNRENTSDELNVNSIISQHVKNKMKQKKRIGKLNNRYLSESDRIAQELYDKNMYDIRSYKNDGDKPIIFSEDEYTPRPIYNKARYFNQNIQDRYISRKDKYKSDDTTEHIDHHIAKTENIEKKKIKFHEKIDHLAASSSIDPPREEINVRNIKKKTNLPELNIKSYMDSVRDINKRMVDYESTEEIDKKINNLKKILMKNDLREPKNSIYNINNIDI